MRKLFRYDKLHGHQMISLSVTSEMRNTLAADPGEVAELVLMSVAVSVSGASAEGVGEAQS